MSESTPDGDRVAGQADDPAAPAAGATPARPRSAAEERLSRFTAANMLRSIVPLALISLAIVAFAAFRQSGVDPVRPVDPTGTVQFAARTADYPLEAPAGLPEDWAATSARTDAGEARDGAPVTLEIGWFTPAEEFAGYVTSDDPRAPQVRAVLDGATEEGTEQIGGRTWTRSTTERGETAYSLEEGVATLVVTGSAPDEELRALAAAVRPVEVG